MPSPLALIFKLKLDSRLTFPPPLVHDWCPQIMRTFLVAWPDIHFSTSILLIFYSSFLSSYCLEALLKAAAGSLLTLLWKVITRHQSFLAAQ